MSNPSPDSSPHTLDRAGTGAGTGVNGEPDPLEKLHKMSRTAGVGTADYVAVNSVSVAAVLLGLASALALLDPILLVVPLAGIVCAVVALRQISRSSGTETGRALAGVGIVLCLLFMGGQIARQIIIGGKTRADRQAITSVMEQFGRKLGSEDFAGAYGMTGRKFQDRVPLAQFERNFKSRFRHPSHGRITSLRSNNLIDFTPDDTGANRSAAGTAIVTLEHGEDRQAMTFNKVGDQWTIDDLPNWFPSSAASRIQGPQPR